ncbi:imidazoleglycerol-phosphate dehydratase HisB [Paracoccaceae bacterium]|nr:imidazoleglycerol-phosphate dehydratase HisB [Paracoccaceae bacterium]
MRSAKIDRVTHETKINLVLNLDGLGKGTIKTGIPFFDHMLDQLTFHSLIDLELDAQGDLEIDYHHTVEDCGICLGKAFSEALGDKKGITRYGFFLLPMDDALIRVALDFSGRSYLSWNVRFPTSKVGKFDLELVREFFNSFSANSGATIHVDMLNGFNSHHISEAIFKGMGKAIKTAITKHQRLDSIPSTKGSL